ncbi:TetR/AcrR family transcriptional regulator [Roseovarius sp.]|uniref:TetR/AcrR family transcriptional regulator n=1 Tax=Roseovarius sp. TaxID=1486281 RepID=UPI003A97C6CF
MSKKPKKWGDTLLSREELRSRKKMALIGAAAQEFRRHGYHGTSMDSIAGSIGVTKAALYRYIRSKDEVLYECFKYSEKVGLRALDLAIQTEGDAPEKLKAFLREFIEGYLSSSLASGAMIEISALTDEQRADVVAGRDRIDAGLIEIIQAGIDDGSLIREKPKLMILTIMGSVNWIPSWFREDGDLGANQIAEIFANTLIDGVRAR